MNEPRLRRPISLVLIQGVVILLLIAGWLTVLGLMSRTFFGGGSFTFEIELETLGTDQIAVGHHSLGATDSAKAVLLASRNLLRLFDVAPLTYMTVRTLGILAAIAGVLALHQVDRIVRATTNAQPFARANARRCRWIGCWMSIAWLFGLAEVLVMQPIVGAAEVEGLWALAKWGMPRIEYAALGLAFCGFTASAVLRYGADLEQERALTI